MNILITGDSWSSGAWVIKEDGRRVSTPVLSISLERDGHEVILKDFPGGNDFMALDEAVKYSDEVDIIIFYKTLTERIIRDQHPRVEKMIKESFNAGDDEFEEIIEKLDDMIYRTLEGLNCRVFLIGGLCKIDQKVNVEYVLPSLIEELTDEEVPDNYTVSDIVDILHRCPKHFYPERMHPNRKAVAHTYNLIKEKI